jgi:hypothetical protein
MVIDRLKLNTDIEEIEVDVARTAESKNFNMKKSLRGFSSGRSLPGASPTFSFFLL